MAYNNNNKKRFKNNYFEQQINRFGEDFLIHKNPGEMQMDAIRMFRDLVRGKIDVRDYAQYFANPQFLESCIVSAGQKYSLHNISFNGVNALTQAMQSQGAVVDDIQMAVLDYHQKASEVYQLISQGLNNFKVTGNIEMLLAIVPMIRPFRDYI